MAKYFDISKEADLDLLHASVREDSELGNVVDQVLWEIVDFYSQRDMQGLTTYETFFQYEFGNRPNTEIKVRLVGYDPDPEDAEEGFREAMRRTIADVVSWTLRNYSVSQGVRSIRQGQRSVTYIGSSPSWSEFPHGWNRRLHNYDARIQAYGV